MHTHHLTALMLNIVTYDIPAALDMIVAHASTMSWSDIDSIMEAATKIDPTFSNDGAAIRDALRDNTGLIIT